MQVGHRIRTAGAHDAPVIARITEAAYAKWVPVIGRKPLPMTVDYNIAVMKHRIDLLEIDGTALALLEMIKESDHLMLENLAVLPNAQGKGFGAILLAHADGVAKNAGLHTVRLLTNKMFQSNVRYYLKNGFMIDREEAFMGGFTTHMVKHI